MAISQGRGRRHQRAREIGGVRRVPGEEPGESSVRVLAIAAHPDDETLGCGGTLLKHSAAGHELHWLIATRATTPKWANKEITEKKWEIERVAAAYSMKQVHRLGFSSTELDSASKSKLMEGIQSVLAAVSPQVVYVVHGGDVHSDHTAVSDAALAVMKPFCMKHLGVSRILAFETLSSTEAAPPLPQRGFLPNVFSDVTAYFEEKLSIMGLYKTELQPDPMPRSLDSLRALGRYRGATIGVRYAEAFMLIRDLM